jgi:hypothetical protein
MRTPSPVLRLPTVYSPAQAWLAFGLTSGIYPQFQFNTFYYVAETFPLSLPVHAFTALDDWIAAFSIYIRSSCPSGTAITVFPIYLWDGTVLHTYPDHLVPTGTRLGGFSPASLSLCFTKIIDPSPPAHAIFGRYNLSPVPKNFYKSDGSLTVTGHAVATVWMNLWLNAPFDSEANTWLPAMVHDGGIFIDPIDRWRLLHSVKLYRRRLRKAPYVAFLTLPPPFPTGTG